jgi:lipopolysaccharide/colanic/teichoic acid biosynthesis glycosyltransferase
MRACDASPPAGNKRIAYRKRLFDITVASIALILSLPFMLAIALAIWLEDRGPILFRQKRIGRGGRLFRVLKFRKFSTRRDEDGSILTIAGDPRYSRVGRFLEATKLNELPQLINVIRGDMSLVGPRPEIPDFLHCYQGRYQRLLDFAPGIFGPSQCTFRNEQAMYPVGRDPRAFYEEHLFTGKADIDLAYYPEATVLDDVGWIGRSLVAVCRHSDLPVQAAT